MPAIKDLPVSTVNLPSTIYPQTTALERTDGDEQGGPSVLYASFIIGNGKRYKHSRGEA
jgi:hypothetical protein